jgi:hypothetical protein
MTAQIRIQAQRSEHASMRRQIRQRRYADGMQLTLSEHAIAAFSSPAVPISLRSGTHAYCQDRNLSQSLVEFQGRKHRLRSRPPSSRDLSGTLRKMLEPKFCVGREGSKYSV